MIRKLIVVLFVILLHGIAFAQTKEIQPTLPGSNVRDFSKPGYKVEGDNIYPTLPGSNVRDFSKPGYKVEGNKVYPTLPGTNVRDFSKPGYKIKE
jgi:hypothetical protein